MQSLNISRKQRAFAAGTTSFEVLVTGATVTTSNQQKPKASSLISESCSTNQQARVMKQSSSNSQQAGATQFSNKNIHPEVYTSIGRWVLEKEGVYSPFSGVVTNQSESFNMVLKSLQQWKEVPVDCIVLSFYLLQSFFMNEITRGLTSQGNYHLHHQFLPLMEEADVSEPAFICVRPDEIVSRIRDGDMTSQSYSPQPQGEVQPQKPPSALTQLERARLILQSGKISFDPKLHLFNVLGSGDRPYVVRLFPRESCSCPSSGTCYHILAVKISIGTETNLMKHRTVNLTMLCKRTRTRKDKTSGRKRPRKMDTDENPAKRRKKSSPKSDIPFDQKQTQSGKNKMSKRKKETTAQKQHQSNGPTSDTSSVNAVKKSKKILKGQNAQADIPSPGSQPPSPDQQPPSPGPLVPYTFSDDSNGCSDQLFGPRCSTPSKAVVSTSALHVSPILHKPGIPHKSSLKPPPKVSCHTPTSTLPPITSNSAKVTTFNLQ